jgi:hypothetical protein
MDTPLTAEAEELVAQLDSVRRVLANIDAKKGDVRAPIYRKVRQEYVGKLQDLRGRIQPILDRIRQAVHDVAAEEVALSAEKDEVEAELEEMVFRHDIGDLDDAAFAEREGGVAGRKTEIETRHAEIRAKVSALNALASRMQVGEIPAEPGTEPAVEPAPEAPADPEPAPADAAADAPVDAVPVDGTIARPPADTVRVAPATDGPTAAPTAVPGMAAWERNFFQAGGADAAEGPAGIFRILQGVNAGKVYELRDAETKIGRDLDNQIQILDPKISRHHFLVERRKRAYLLRDQESANGTFVNNRRVDEAILSDGDEIRIGGTIIRFQAS